VEQLFEELLRYHDPVYIIQAIEAAIGLKWVIPVLVLIVFAETGLLIGFFLPGDSLLFVTGVFSATGQLQTPVGLTWVLLIAAAIAGDQLGYWIGKKMGNQLFHRKDTWLIKRKHLHRTKAFYDQHGAKTIIIGRFVPIVRTFAPVLAGVAPLAYHKFVPYNIIGGVVWITSLVLGGYFLGGIIEERYIKYVLYGVILVSVIPIVTAWIKEVLAKKRAKAAGQAYYNSRKGSSGSGNSRGRY
jgi:membrane-associated protein